MQRSTHCAFHHSSASSPQFIATSISRALAVYEREAAAPFRVASRLTYPITGVWCASPAPSPRNRGTNEYGHRAAFARQFEGGATFPSIGNDFSVERKIERCSRD